MNKPLTSDTEESHITGHDGGAFKSESLRAVCAALDNPEINQVPGQGHGGARANAGRKPKPVEPTFISRREPEGERWYCVCCDPGKDLTADIETRLAGFLVFAPTIWKPATSIRRDTNGVVRRGLPDRIEPLFRRYFFTRFDRSDYSWTTILHLPGVRRIISSTLGYPIAVPDSVIEAIKGRAHANGCLYPATPASATRLAPGTRVKPVVGAFADQGWIGELAEMSDGKRVKVLLSIMGRQVPVVMPQAAVEVVG